MNMQSANEPTPSGAAGVGRPSGPANLAPLPQRPALPQPGGSVGPSTSLRRPLAPVLPLPSRPSATADPPAAGPSAAGPSAAGPAKAADAATAASKDAPPAAASGASTAAATPPPAIAVSPGPEPDAAREPASIAGLKSPPSKGPAPPIRDATLGTTSTQGEGNPPSPHLPGAVPATPKGEPATGTAAVGGTLAVSTTVKGKVPPPPPGQPPDHAMHDDRALEEYIPFGFVELREKLLIDHEKDVFSDPAVRQKFLELCKWMSLRNSLRLAIDYGDAHEKYALLDPDKDTLVLKASAAEAAGQKGEGDPLRASRNMSLLRKPDITSRVEELYKELDNILNKAEFQELPREDLDKAKNDKSLMGLHVISASDEYLDYRVHYRGSRTKKIKWRRWGLFTHEIEMNVYERLAISFRLKKPVCEDDIPEDPSVAGLTEAPWYKRWFCGWRVKGTTALSQLRDEFLYLKMFKDVLQCDVDMLLPGAVIKFTWFDYMLIWLPILVGLGFAIWKAVKGTIKFDNLKDAALSVLLIVMPITWGFRVYMEIKKKERLHQAHLNALFLLHNLNNNAGVISQLLDEAQEQEDNETMLAYFFLWQGQAQPKPVRKPDLDRSVEKYLQGKLDELNVKIRMDFEVAEAIMKLQRIGLLQVTAAEGKKLLQVLPLDEALEKAHVRNFNEQTETGQPELPQAKSKRQGNLALAWHECKAVFRATGQAFRFWWNAETGESTYFEPDEPYIKLGAKSALDMRDAHGIAMSDPAKQKAKVP